MLKETGPAKSGEEAVSASRSLADELIDTVGQPTEVRKKLVCPNCKSTDFTVRSELGSSTKINVCVKCNTKVFTKKKAFSPRVQTHGQGTSRGPYYSPNGPKPKVDKYSPKYKLKSKPRKNDE